MDSERFIALLKALAREDVDHVRVGAVALNLHGIADAAQLGEQFGVPLVPAPRRFG